MTRLLRYTLQLTFFACLVGAQPVWAQKGGKPENNPPVAKDDSATVVQGNTVIIPILANDSDPDDDSLSVQSVRRARGVVHILEDGTLSYKPTPNFIGEDIFEYAVDDGRKGRNRAQVRVRVIEGQPNLDPVAYDAAFDTQEEVAFSDTLPAFDADGDDLTYSIVNQGTKGTAIITDATTNEFAYTPDPDANGQDSVTFRVYDGAAYSNEAIVTITIEPINDAPVITSAASTMATEDILFSYTATATDVDGDDIAFSFTDLPSWLAVEAGGATVSGIPTEGFTSGSFTVTADDGKLSDALVVTITVGAVNDPPMAVDDEATTNEDTPVTIDVLDNDSDPDGDTLSVASVTQGANGSAEINTTDSTITYTPDENYNGSDSFTYTVSDGQGGSATAGVAVTVNPVNDAPVAQHDDTTTGMRTPVTIDILANDYDVDGDPLTVKNVEQANGVVDINDDGSLFYTPNPNFTGADDFVYRLEDGNGGVAMGSVTVLVDFENNPPVADSLTVSTDEDVSVDITLTASDVDEGDVLTFKVVNGPSSGSLSGSAPNLTYSPNQDFNGVDEFTFSVTDPYGAAGSATVSITVTPVNDAPVITSPATAEATEDEPFTYTATASDVDDATVTITFSNLPGWLTADGSTVSGTPGEGTPSATFTVIADDGHNVNGTATLGVTIAVSPVNDAPVAFDDEASTDGNTPVTIDVLENDVDADVGDVLSVASASDPAHGEAVINADGTVTYIPDENFSGTDSFTYTATDGELVSGPATVTILVNLAGELAADEPVEPDKGGTVTTDIGVTVEIPGGSLSETVNIQIGIYESIPPGAPQLAGMLYFFGPSGATFDPPATITVPYDPLRLPDGFDPMDLVLLIYNESDGTWEEALNSTVDTDAETVSGKTYHFSGFAAGLLLDRAPQLILSLPEPVIEEDAQSTVIIENLNDYFADPNFGDQIDFDATSPDEGLHRVFVTDEAELIVDPKPNFYGDIRIVITATDDGGLWVSDTLFLTVVADNDPPFFPPGFRELLADFMTINEDQVLRIPLMADDVEGDDVTFHAASDTSGVTTLVQDTVLWVIPAPDWFGTANIGLSASDGQDTTYLDPVTLTVGAVNDAPSAFTLLEPANAAVIQLQSSDLGDSLTFAWDEAVDPDDPVRYAFMLTDSVAFYFEYGDTTVNEVRVPYADILAAFRDQELTSATFWWTIMAISGQDTIEASDGSFSLTIDTSTLAVVDQSQLPQFFALHQNYPNPFNPVTTLRFELPAHCRALLVIYDMRGREVIRLVDGYVSAGYNKVVWNSSDASGRPVPSGIYFARLITSENTHIIKMSLIR